MGAAFVYLFSELVSCTGDNSGFATNSGVVGGVRQEGGGAATP